MTGTTTTLTLPTEALERIRRWWEGADNANVLTVLPIIRDLFGGTDGHLTIIDQALGDTDMGAVPDPDDPEFFVPAPPEETRENLADALAQVVNRLSVENASNTPDFLLAEFLVDCLSAYERVVQARENWRTVRPDDDGILTVRFKYNATNGTLSNIDPISVRGPLLGTLNISLNPEGD